MSDRKKPLNLEVLSNYFKFKNFKKKNVKQIGAKFTVLQFFALPMHFFYLLILAHHF